MKCIKLIVGNPKDKKTRMIVRVSNAMAKAMVEQGLAKYSTRSAWQAGGRLTLDDFSKL